MTVIIDVHAHYYPRRYLELIGRPGLLPTAAAALAGQDIAERLALLDQIGIGSQVLSVSQAQPYLSDSDAAAEAAKVANEEYMALCDAHRGRFLTFAALPLPHVDQPLAEIGRVAAIGPVVGFTMGCSVAGRQLDDPLFEPVFAELDRRGPARRCSSIRLARRARRGWPGTTWPGSSGRRSRTPRPHCG
jgi:6-methylsalicylate decarboxylase